MDRRTTHRPLLGGLLMLLAAAGVTIGAPPASAQPPTLDQVVITGPGLAEPLVVRAQDTPERAAALHAEVSWLVDRDGEATEPDPDSLGPLYTMVVHLDGEARHRFHLFPLAEGGPKAFRPAEQPDRTADEGWFYGRVGMAETLSAAGVPLPGGPADGGTGGGEPAPGATTGPDPGPLGFLDEWRNGLLAASALAVLLLAGVGWVAYLIRRAV